MSYTCLLTSKPVQDCTHCRRRQSCAGVDLYYADANGRWVVVDHGRVSIGKTREVAIGKALRKRLGV